MPEELEGASFEKCLKELEEVVASLEGGEVPLDEALKMFERGVRLVSACSKKLDEAEGKIQVLLEGGAGGESSLEPLDGEEGEETEE